MESEITIKGVTASLGQVDGEIFIVKSFEDLVKFKEGAILVSITTDPSYTLIMGKCKGIITAIGGIASHAAIIAREAGLPCIVGIGEKEIQKLQTGDKIFMDANSGTIYKKENKIDLFTEGLLKKFGPNRVLDTPLAESGIVGFSIGMAIAGLKPVAEIQFDGFIYPAFDQRPHDFF